MTSFFWGYEAKYGWFIVAVLTYDIVQIETWLSEGKIWRLRKVKRPRPQMSWSILICSKHWHVGDHFQTNPNESRHLQTLTVWDALQSWRTSGGTISLQRCEALSCLQIHTPCYIHGAKAHSTSPKNWGFYWPSVSLMAIWCTSQDLAGCLVRPGTNVERSQEGMLAEPSAVLP